MKIQTLGHACMALIDDQGTPVMITDPWLIGSTYWRSWWLQSYPTDSELAMLSQAKHVYITHEHMDHFHPPSIRKLGYGPTYLCPALPQEQIAQYLNGQGFQAKALEPLKWHSLGEAVQVLSIPLPNDDSVLLVDTPKAFIVNMNDSKPMGYQVKRIRQYIDNHVSGRKKVVLLSSYSPASPVNSFRKDAQIVSMKDKADYVHRVSELSDLLQADYYMPFASQVIFYRDDSVWANEYKVSVEDLKMHWKAQKTQLCHPYTTIDFDTWTVSHLPESDYRRDEDMIRKKVDQQADVERQAQFTDQDVADLRKKLAANNFWLPLLFRKGIGFVLDGRELTYKPWGKKIVPGIQNPSFSLMMPAQALKDVLYTGHFADLGITMFTLIILNGKTSPKMVYLFFLLISLHDYHHTWSFSNFWKWFRSTLRLNNWRIPALG
jgi:UDP-MurNAc hydroxylase